METWIRRETVYQGRIFSLLVGETRLDDGRVVIREMVQHNGGVAVVPVLDDSVILVRQFRIAIGRSLLELPAGRLEGDEAPEQRARLELEEETGYRAGRMVLAASYYSSVGFTDERMFIFLAFDLEATAQNLEFDERIEIVKWPIATLENRLAAHEIEDAKTIIGLRALLAQIGD